MTNPMSVVLKEDHILINDDLRISFRRSEGMWIDVSTNTYQNYMVKIYVGDITQFLESLRLRAPRLGRGA
ncbi:hypothetical protein N0V94_007620 [Neodidymelliopsis sp. IMI 364377]|nr:hypothetical protein N0V94_007620 [Neodidymelliopsis sp. IMI 364377]